LIKSAVNFKLLNSFTTVNYKDLIMHNELPKFYFDTHFLNHEKLMNWPSNFAIITAYATTGEKWTDEQNIAADNALKEYLNSNFSWVKRLTGFSPETAHSEPGWAVNAGWQQACEIGMNFKQDAIYFVAGNSLSVSFCDEKRKLVAVGDFSKRLQRSISLDV